VTVLLHIWSDGLLVVWKTLESGLRNDCTRKAETAPRRQIHIPTPLAGTCPCQQVALSQQAVPGYNCLSPPAEPKWMGPE